jgi:hypothetical protein
MAENFTLSVFYKNKIRKYDAELRMNGYVHAIVIVVDDQEIIFEPDEERNYRAVLTGNPEEQNTPDVELLQAIVNEIEVAFK